MLFPSVASAIEYRLDSVKTSTYTVPIIAPAVASQITHASRTVNCATGQTYLTALSTTNTVTTPTSRSGTVTIGTGSLQYKFVVELGYISTYSGVAVFYPVSDWYEAVPYGSGEAGQQGNYNPEGKPQFPSGEEANTSPDGAGPADGWEPYPTQGYNLGSGGGGGGGGGTSGGGGYKNNSPLAEGIDYKVRDPSGNIVEAGHSAVAAGDTWPPKVEFPTAGYTIEYTVTGTTVVDGNYVDTTSTGVLVANNPITSQTEPNPITTPVVTQPDPSQTPPTVTTEPRTVTGTAAPTNAADDQRAREIRAEIARLATIADNASKLAHTDAQAIKTAVEAERGGSTNMTATNTKLDGIKGTLDEIRDGGTNHTSPADSLEADKTGEGFLDKVGLLGSKLNTIGADLTGLVSALSIPAGAGTGSLNVTLALDASIGGNKTLDFDQYMWAFSVLRGLVLAGASVWFVSQIITTVRGAMA